MIWNYLKRLLISTRSKSDEGGAMFVMAFLSILMFLFFTILMLDVPYLERVGRSMQRTLDTAALAGTVQLTSRLATNNNDGTPNFNARLAGWLRAKRAVFAFLRMNPIAGVENLVFDISSFNVATDPLENLNPAYGLENYTFNEAGLQANLRISRGIYHRPFTWGDPTFYRTESGSNYWVLNADGTVSCNTDQNNQPSECLINNVPGTSQPLISVADSVQLSLTITNVPTLFGKLLGFSSTSLTRTALSVPQ